VALDLPAGPLVRLLGSDLRVTVADQLVLGGLTITRTRDALGAPAVLLEGTGLRLALGDPTALLLTQSGTARLLVSAAGVVGRFEVTAVATAPGVSLSAVQSDGGRLALAVDTTGRTPLLRLEGTRVRLAAAGATLLADVVVQSAGRDVTVGVTAASVTLPGLTVRDATGLLLLTSSGLAGRVDAAVDLGGSSPIGLSGRFGLAVNTTGAAVRRLVPTADGARLLDLPAGPLLQVFGEDVAVRTGGQVLTGDVVLAPEGAGLRLRASGVSLTLGDATRAVLRLSDGAADLLVTPGTTPTVAGTVSGRVSLEGVPGVRLSGTLAVAVDTAAADAADRVVVRGSAVVLEVLGQRLSAGTLAVRRTTGGGLRVDVTGAELALADGAGRVLARATVATADLRLSSAGVVGTATGTVALTTPGVALRSALAVQVNTTGALSDGIPAGLRLSATGASLEIAGQRLGGTVSIAVTGTGTGRRVELAVSALRLTLVAGSTTLLDVTDGAATVVLSPAGVTLDLALTSFTLTLPGVDSTGATLRLQLNTAAATASGLPAGPFLRVEISGTLTVLGIGLTGTFALQQQVRAGFVETTLSSTPAPTAVAAGDVDGDGALDQLVGTASGYALRLAAGATTAPLPTVAGPVRAVLLVDLDRDGDLDAVVLAAPSTGAATTVLRNLGRTTTGWRGYELAASVTTPLGTALAAGDLDGDGLPDVVVGASGSGAAGRLLLSRAAGGLGGTPTTLAHGDTASVALVDLDRDGDLDLVVGGSTSAYRLNLGESTSPPSPTSWQGLDAPVALTTTGAVSAVAAGDLDGDGFAELVLVGTGGTHVASAGLDGTTGAFRVTAPTLVAGGTAGTAVAVADVDGDGDRDTVVGSGTGTWLLRGDGRGALAAAQRLTSTASGAGVVVRNADTDADADVLLAGTAGLVLLRAEPERVTTLGLRDVAVTIDGSALASGTGALVVLPDGVAGLFTATRDSGAVQVRVRFNSTTREVDELVRVGADDIRVRFTTGEVAAPPSSDPSGPLSPFTRVEASAGVVLPPLEVYGTLSSGSTVTVFLGDGPLLVSGSEENPQARGLRVTGTVTRYTDPNDFAVRGAVTLLRIDGVTLTGELLVDRSSSGLVVSGSGLVLAVAGVRLTGGFSFRRESGTTTVTLGADSDDVVLELGDGLVTATLTGTVSLSAAGVVAALSAQADLGLPGVDLVAPGRLLLNTTAADGTADGTAVPARTVRLQLGTTSTAAVLVLGGTRQTDGSVTGGQRLSGVFVLEQATLPVPAGAAPGTAPERVVRLGATGLSFDLGAPGARAEVRNGVGAFVVRAAGIAGRLTAAVTVVMPGGTAAPRLDGVFTLAVSTLTAPVAEDVTVDGRTVSLVLPAGPYVRVEGAGAVLRFGDQTLTGDVVLERATATPTGSTAPQDVVRIGFRRVSLVLGDGASPFVSLSDGSGVLLLSTTGLAGTLTGTVSVQVPGLGLTGTFTVEVNTTTARVQAQVVFGEAASAPTAVALADVDNDGDVDLLVGDSAGVLLHLSDGVGDPYDSTAPVRVLTGAVTALAVGDVDRDGAADLLVGRSGSTELWLGDGAGGFEVRTVSLGSAATGLALGDVDRDGKLDAVVAGTGGGLFLGDGTGGFGTGTSLGVTGYLVALGDVDGDGDLDLVEAGSGGVRVARGATGSTFGALTAVTGSTGAVTALAVQDVDADGRADLLLGTASGLVVRRSATTPTGTLQFAAASAPLTSTAPTAVAAGDLDRTGAVDLVVAGGSGQPLLLLGTATGFAAGTPVGAVDLDVPAGAFLGLTGRGVVLTLGGQSLTGDLELQQVTVGGVRTVTVDVENLTIPLPGLTLPPQ
ncbi:MAG TPA: VCBS repeat-containing protein, partial [Mycobacteriales bacterium]|nr:VCBS repeat-containing protein [Mycobacteriales bacterium]